MVACFSALLFWYIEASWKTFQYAYYDRAWEIEEYFRGKKNWIVLYKSVYLGTKAFSLVG